MQVVLPPDVVGGQTLRVQSPAAKIVYITVPLGAVGQQAIQVQYC